MKNKLLYVTIIVGTIINSSTIRADESVMNVAEVTSCQDQAENYGNGRGEDIVELKCLNAFKQLASKKAIVEFPAEKLKYFGYKNMIIVERTKENVVKTELIAGNSTELKSVIAIALDEKNKELVVLESSGDVNFFTTTLTGNVAPYRILKHQELKGASEIAIDQVHEQIAIYNKKTDSISFFSRLANKNAPKEKQHLEILKTIVTPIDFSHLSIDPVSSDVHGIDKNTKNIINFSSRSISK
jgi:hypothetical protein